MPGMYAHTMLTQYAVRWRHAADVHSIPLDFSLLESHFSLLQSHFSLLQSQISDSTVVLSVRGLQMIPMYEGEEKTRRAECPFQTSVRGSSEADVNERAT